MVDRYRINLNYKYENLSTRYDIPENGSFTATYSNDQTKYTIFDTKGNEICKFNVDYQKERPVHEYVYPNHVSYIEVLPNFTNRDRLIDSALGSLNIAIISIVEASNPVPTPLLGHRCRSSQEITGSPTPFSTSNHYLWICASASLSLSNPNIAA